MANSRAFGLFILVAAFAPLYPKPVFADTGYANFSPTQVQVSALTSDVYTTCRNNTGGNTYNINACLDDEYARLDVRLNRSYQATLRRLSRPKSMALRSSERGWLATRSDKCLADLKEEYEGGGTLYSILIRECELQELKRRITWIEMRR